MCTNKIITLMGPTASGKTALAMALYDSYPIDIISVDSALIYRGMDIGTAKPTEQERAVYPHKLINILDPNEYYSAATFRHDAISAIKTSFVRKRIPVLVGGTMLYFKALLEGLSPLPKANYIIRKKIEDEAKCNGWSAIHDWLQRIDPVSAKRIHPNDPQRLSRALEVYLISGKSLTELTQMSGIKLPYQVVQFAIAPPTRQLLHDNIALRFQNMLKEGFENEVAGLMARGDLNPNLPSMRSVGYRQMWAYLSKEYDYDDMVFKALAASRQLAKRQMTWLRGWSQITWLDSNKPLKAVEMIAKQLNQ